MNEEHHLTVGDIIFMVGLVMLLSVYCAWEGYRSEVTEPTITIEERHSALERMKQPVAMAYPNASVWQEIKK